MIRVVFAIIGLMSVLLGFAQTGPHVAIDTADSGFRKQLVELYNIRAAKTRLSFKTIEDRALNKMVNTSYSELNSEFIDKVSAGLFVQAPAYEQQISKLVNKIVAANPQFTALANMRVLLSFSDTPNASAIGDGFIVINLPLLAKLEQEHELAFIISHELAHNLLNHPQKGLLEYAQLASSEAIKKQTKDIERKKYNYAKEASSLYRQIIYGSRKRHRQIEFQADSLGFILYRNAFIDKQAVALSSFSTLEHLDTETDSLHSNDYLKLFATQKQPFKLEWIESDEINKYKYDKTIKFWEIDSLKTHPDCDARANRLQNLFNIASQNDEVNDTAYRQLAAKSTHDHVLGLYVLKQYGQSLYQALLLLKNDPDNLYLKEIIYRNLVRIQDAQRNYTLNKYVDTMSPRYSNSYNTFLAFLRNLRKSELAEITNHYLIKT